MAAVDARTRQAAPAPDETEAEVRVRPQRLHREDLLLLAGAAASSLSLVWLIFKFLYAGSAPLAAAPLFIVCWFVGFVVIYWLAVSEVHGRLIATDAVMMVLVTAAGTAMLAVLVLVMATVIKAGQPTLTPQFLVRTVEICGPLASAQECGGVGNAIVGTVEQVGLAVAMAVPLSLLCAIFLNEIGGPLERPVRLIVDAMSGVPTIVASLFIYAVWVVGLQKSFSGFAASMALTMLMLPTVTRTCEVVLRLVPDGLREGALALGASEWRMIWGVVLPTARSGLISAVLLGIAREVGETAPLLLLAFGSRGYNWNPFSGGQEGLPLFIYNYIRHSYPGTAPYQRAWSAAVVLTFMVVGLFTLTRLVVSLTSVEARERRATRRLAMRTQGAGHSAQGEES